jgi:hypothetical protein
MCPAPLTALPGTPDLMDELIQAVARSAGLAPGPAGLAVDAMLRFLAARLPSPLFGELQIRLNAPGGTLRQDPPSGRHNTPTHD